MTDQQKTEMNEAIAKLTGLKLADYATCRNCAAKAERALGLASTSAAHKPVLDAYFAALCEVVKDGRETAHPVEVARASAWHRCAAMLKAFGGAS